MGLWYLNQISISHLLLRAHEHLLFSQSTGRPKKHRFGRVWLSFGHIVPFWDTRGWAPTCAFCRVPNSAHRRWAVARWRKAWELCEGTWISSEVSHRATMLMFIFYRVLIEAVRGKTWRRVEMGLKALGVLSKRTWQRENAGGRSNDLWWVICKGAGQSELDFWFGLLGALWNL